jgi:1-acyl-sn-glycerol-3-phosphate acyltransferase
MPEPPTDASISIAALAWAPIVLLLSWLLLRRVAAWWLRLLEAFRPQAQGRGVFGLEHRIVARYLRWMHQPRWEGFDAPLVRATLDRGPLIVASNHTAGIDPLLLQMPLRRLVRWMMWRGEMHPAAAPLWRHVRVIPVAQDQRDLSALRVGLRALADGEVVGIFPEGGIERPPRTIKAFEPGLGLLAAKSGAPVLLCFIEGTPAGESLGSLVTPSRSRVRALGIFTAERGERPDAFVDRLRRELLRASGWPAG